MKRRRQHCSAWSRHSCRFNRLYGRSTARRDETRREHLIELQHLYGFEPFTSRKYREIAQALIPLADQTHHTMVLIRAVIDQLAQQARNHSTAFSDRAAVCRSDHARRTTIYRKLTGGLNEVQRTALDDVLRARSDTKQSMLTWLRQGPGAANPRNILTHIECSSYREVRPPVS